MQPETDADAGWVSALSGRSVTAAERALAEARDERRLFLHLAHEHRREGRPSYIEIDAPLELFALVRLLRPRHVLEAGVSSGVSSAYLLAALARNGRGTLHSADLPSRPRRPPRPGSSSWSLPPGRASGWAVPGALRSRWDLRVADKAEVVPRWAEELREVRLVVYDLPHNEADLDREFRELDRRVPSGGVAIVDHGPGGGRCAALQRWARARGSTAIPRQGLGLFGARFGPRALRRSRRGARAVN